MNAHNATMPIRHCRPNLSPVGKQWYQLRITPAIITAVPP